MLRNWLERARRYGVREPRALALATVDGQGRPSTRIVVIAELGERGVVFATHADSQKGRELAQNPWASGVLYWRESSVGVGPVNGLPDGAGGPTGHQSLLDAPLQLDQAASIQRRVTTCGGRRKTQPTVRDGLTTTFHLLEGRQMGS
ncbi:pyridoxamine 5'-phosphate oxidase [Pseudomonas aeruginosa PA38182]|nr:pyridoxamine 5'-phosphate oxidase [Pseudomonas aeruginosa PA38182]